MSGVVSSAHPDAAALRSATALEEALQRGGLARRAEHTRRCAAVLKQLEALSVEWVRRVALAEGLSEPQAAAAGARVIALGSHALDAAIPGADVDALVVVPYFVKREKFFEDGGMGGLLRALEGVRALNPVPGAFVPVIKFSMRVAPDGAADAAAAPALNPAVSVDLLLARTKLPQIARGPAAPSADELVLRCIEAADLTSLNGPRVAAAILRLVPNEAAFRQTLLTIKLWAARRFLNSYTMGFPGGVAWALLAARVCQFYPNAAPSTLVARFFSTWHIWKFSTAPVLVDDAAATTELPAHLSAEAASTHYDPRAHARDRAYAMGVGTPCYPRLCATNSVGPGTLAVLRRELGRAAALAQQGEASGAADRWAPLFAPLPFFGEYRRFVAVDVGADDGTQLLHWHGWVQSRVRKLVSALERSGTLSRVHPLPHALRLPPPPPPAAAAPSCHCTFLVGLAFAKPAAPAAAAAAPKTIDLRAAATEFLAAVRDWEEKPRLCPSAHVAVRSIGRDELPAECGDDARVLAAIDALKYDPGGEEEAAAEEEANGETVTNLGLDEAEALSTDDEEGGEGEGEEEEEANGDAPAAADGGERKKRGRRGRGGDARRGKPWVRAKKAKAAASGS